MTTIKVPIHLPNIKPPIRAIGEPKPKKGKTHKIVKIKKIVNIKNKLEFLSFKKYNLFNIFRISFFNIDDNFYIYSKFTNIFSICYFYAVLIVSP